MAPGGDTVLREPARRAMGLLQPPLGQGRIAPPLHPMLQIELRLPVPYQIKPRHGALPVSRIA